MHVGCMRIAKSLGHDMGGHDYLHTISVARSSCGANCGGELWGELRGELRGELWGEL